jgi:transcriptional regulator with XRE-family HTH domain
MLRAYRHHQEMSVGEVSASIGIRANTYREIETGTVPRAKSLQRIFQWLAEDSATIPMPIEHRSSTNRNITM